MADKTIGELPSLTTMESDTLIPVEHDGAAKSMSGSVLSDYVYDCVEDDVETIAEIIAVGPKGDDGVSPTLSSSKSGSTTTVNYTDVNHTTPAVLATLEDGNSPTLSSSKTGRTTTIYYTDATHTSGTDVLATITDGIDGTGVDLYWATYGTSTYSEITTALNAGKLPVVYYSSRLYVYEKTTGTTTHLHYFTAADMYGSLVLRLREQNGNWEEYTYNFANLDSNNKVRASQTSPYVITVPDGTTSVDLTNDEVGCLILAKAGDTFTLPSGGTAGTWYEIMKYGAGASAVTVTAPSSVLLNGVAGGSKTISTQYSSIKVYAMGWTGSTYAFIAQVVNAL